MWPELQSIFAKLSDGAPRLYPVAGILLAILIYLKLVAVFDDRLPALIITLVASVAWVSVSSSFTDPRHHR
ncbi:hypothetical protein [Sphingomonas crocodyli]|uniref:Uncharacterized protein n=1 Tax=Sphingomonas crocodyli TaxID=1979270 RepID=A0A437LZQ0_9SPHN|nr:hypothetical protein [Sphingomonas crocodyli]RVT90911.1 hypothetical protein EOD43_15335 [Sphingomonas crocodyli]